MQNPPKMPWVNLFGELVSGYLDVRRATFLRSSILKVNFGSTGKLPP